MPGQWQPTVAISLKKSQKIALVCLLRVDQLEGPNVSSNTHLLPFPFPTQREFAQNEEGMGKECSQDQSLGRLPLAQGNFETRRECLG